jgi:hypothetical protein
MDSRSYPANPATLEDFRLESDLQREDLAWALKMIERAGDLVWSQPDKDRYWSIKRMLGNTHSKGK